MNDQTVMGEPLPEFLSDYAESSLAEEQASLVALDVDLTITWVNAAWRAFACDNGAPDVLRHFGVGSCYVDGIGGEQRSHYADILRQALATGAPLEALYECSTADLYRLMRLRALPFPGKGLLLEHTLVESRPHDRTVEPADPVRFPDRRGLVLQCGNCRRTQDPSARSWHWIPNWVSAPPSNTTHGVCTVCLGYFYRRVLRQR